MILSANSPVLRAMIHSGMRESQANEMHIENFSLSCVETLLNYFYGYNVNDSIELFQAADFYQLNILKEFCEDNLLFDLDHRNVLDIYKVAKLCNAERMMSIARQEIINQKWKILQDTDWKTKIKELDDTDLVMDLIQPESSQVQIAPRRKNNFVEDFSSIENLRLLQLHSQRHAVGLQGHLLPYQQKLEQQQELESLYRRKNEEFFIGTFKKIFSEEFCLIDQKPYICLNSEKFYSSLEGKEVFSETDKIILQFLYTGEIENLADHVSNLLTLSIEMEFEYLRKTCVEYLIDTLSVENVLERYIMASKGGLEDLADSCFEIIKREKAEILSSSEWRTLVKENVDIMIQLILKLI